MSRVFQFKTQRVIFTFAVFLTIFFFTTSVLWNHLEKVVIVEGYQMLAKAGLLLLPLVALMMTIWELFVDKAGPRRRHEIHDKVKRLVNWCFWGALILAGAEIIHAGALLKLESSAIEQTATIAAVGDAQAKIAGETAARSIEAAGESARKLNASGQRRTANAAIKGGNQTASDANAKATDAITEVAAATKPKTFLPESYTGGGMYFALPLLALVFFGVTMMFAREAAPFVDADDDGKPDAAQSPSPVGFAPLSPLGPRRPNLRPAMARRDDDSEDHVDHSSRPLRADFSPPKDTVSSGEEKTRAKTHVSSDFDQTEAMQILRDVLKTISFRLPGRSFKADLKADCVWIRLMKSHEGLQETEASAKATFALLSAALQSSEADFQTRLERFLTKKGFDLT